MEYVPNDPESGSTSIPPVEKIDSGVSKFPTRLKQIPQPPKQLYVRGAFREFDLPMIAIVGSRRCTAYGAEVAATLAAGLVQHGIPVVSGLARGIDQAAHDGALRAGGPTVAVVPSHMLDFLARSSEVVRERLLPYGALISEWDDTHPTESWHFPVRNRIISGLSVGVLVVEAAERSGALITVRHAADQGKEVFAVPGDITRETSRGTNKLIQDGAKLVTRIQDILEEIPSFQFSHGGVGVGSGEQLPLSLPEEKIRQALSHGPLTMDDLTEFFDGSHRELTECLFRMETEGVIHHSNGKILLV